MESVKWVKVPLWLEQHQGTIGRSKLYEMVRRGEIAHVRVGRNVLVAEDALDRMHEAQAGADQR